MNPLYQDLNKFRENFETMKNELDSLIAIHFPEQEKYPDIILFNKFAKILHSIINKYYSVDVSVDNREENNPNGRFIFFKLMKEITDSPDYTMKNISLKTIGKFYSKDYSSVIHGINKITGVIELQELLTKDNDKLTKNELYYDYIEIKTLFLDKIKQFIIL